MDRENPQSILNVSVSTPRTAGACQPPSSRPADPVQTAAPTPLAHVERRRRGRQHRPLELQRRDDAGAWLAAPVALTLKSRRSSGSLLPGLARASMPMRGAVTVSSQGSIQTSRETRRLRLIGSRLMNGDSHGSRRRRLPRASKAGSRIRKASKYTIKTRPFFSAGMGSLLSSQTVCPSSGWNGSLNSPSVRY